MEQLIMGSSLLGVGCCGLGVTTNFSKLIFIRPSNEGAPISRGASVLLQAGECDLKDGESRGNPRLVVNGGVLRDENGCWILGFTHNVGWASSVTTELWEVFIGLEHAWNLGIRKLVVEVDSEVARNLVAGSAHCSPITARLARVIRCMLEREWLVDLHQCYWKAKSFADWIVRWSLQFPFGS
ncbi:hypothetical protein CRG98_034233 [Punica granatum]|uniref:RNase H type-1 domain-containing protein n=1 Tax=Punica granatum TaxID=22663 RepID=A0A2I0IN42_PUNGR|nr:hypothetical protein CRG98_034233 [Punica granatum]